MESVFEGILDIFTIIIRSVGGGIRWICFFGQKTWNDIKKATILNFSIGLIILISIPFLFPISCKKITLFLINLILNRN